MAIAKIPLVPAARKIPTDPTALRRTANRFGLTDRQDGQRALDPRLVELMRRTKAASGYLIPHWIKTPGQLMAAIAEISESEISDITELEA